MANLKEIRNRITSVNSTMQITSAMKMVSAAKLKRAQDAVTQLLPYANKLQEIQINLSASLDSSEGVYSQEREVKNVMFVAVTSNRGLCGGFNNNITKRVNVLAKDYANANVHFLAIGKKAQEFSKKNFADTNMPEIPTDLEKLYADLNFKSVSEVAELIMELYREEKVDKVVLVYNHFVNAANQTVMTEQFLPIESIDAEENVTSNADYIFVPSKEKIIEDIVPKSLKIQLYKGVLDSHAGEHGARMTAMHKATDNAGDMLFDLKLTYNKARQASITNEILEIVGGAEALKN
ncbi:MAG: ATP synthase F1 subunit gamma [Flavobacteriales bacterium]|jgi:F-type H+-transporting ATPase subunit gamma|nr:ATP synthase F1 subunit gamma [bacterium]MDB9931692.1 ATP synthase F1 subunit gamma [Flavobacteriales bacterium]MDG1174214.1 ATP synthase F1 subunit gamma [Flavobacteriales bacterium]